jgi:BMFP domain-containing protein YqiC
VSQIIERSSETRRREKLHRQIGALESKLAQLQPQYLPRDREKVWKLVAKVKRLEAELRQPMLPL